MTITRAYLQSKGISANTPEIFENVYFENGVFNEALSYEGIGLDNQIVTRGDYRDFANQGGSSEDNIVWTTTKDYFETAKIFQFLGTNAGQIVLDGTDLVSTIANPTPYDVENTRYQTDYGLLMMPVKLPPNKYSRLYINAEFVNRIGDTQGFDIHFAQIVQYNNYHSFATPLWKYASNQSLNTVVEIVADSSIFRDDSLYLGFDFGNCQQTRIKKIWFE